VLIRVAAWSRAPDHQVEGGLRDGMLAQREQTRHLEGVELLARSEKKARVVECDLDILRVVSRQVGSSLGRALAVCCVEVRDTGLKVPERRCQELMGAEPAARDGALGDLLGAVGPCHRDVQTDLLHETAHVPMALVGDVLLQGLDPVERVLDVPGQLGCLGL
jgi:hypothetical protein